MTSLDTSATQNALMLQPIGKAGRQKLGPLQLLLRNKGATVAALLLVAFVLTALFAPLLAPHDPLKQNLRSILKPPSFSSTIDSQGNTLPPHYFGTDKIGRDLLSRVIYGARVSLLVAVISVTFSAILGTLLGLFSGFYRGTTDSVIMMLTDIQLSFPAILLAIVIVAGLGPGLRNTIVVLVITNWVWYTRVVRAETLSIREREFVQSARTTGCSNSRIVFRHILPQIVPPVLVLSTLQIGAVIILEAALSFLGLGVQPPQPSWGNLLADGRDLLWTAWWMAFFPGIALSLVIWSSNIFGDWLRDVLDPRLRK
jgi:peptide/nickel transport system permease protein